MEIKVLKKPIEVLLDKDGKEYGVKLRQPTYGEMMSFLSSKRDSEIIEILDKLVIEFINIKMIDEEENELELTTLTQYLDATMDISMLTKASEAIALEMKKKAEFTKK